MQINTNRDADINDLQRDLKGAISFPALYASCDRRQEKAPRKWDSKFTFWTWGISLFFVLVSFGAWNWSIEHILRELAVPIFFDFEHGGQERFPKLRNTKLEIVAAPERWKEAGQGYVGQVVFNPAIYPGFHIKEPYPDRREYNLLTFEAYSELDKAVTLSTRIEDKHHQGLYEDRYDSVVRIKPEPNRIEIPLEKVLTDPAH